MHIDKFKQPDGWYISESGTHYENAESFLHGCILNFCGCGRPELSLLYVHDVLQHVHNLKLLVWEDKLTYEAWNEKGKTLFKHDGAEYFTYYVLTELELLEHGGSVPGWLTDKGVHLLEDISELYNLCKSPNN